MSKQAETTGQRVQADDLVLPDESDRIIADLRTQLRSLQAELSAARKDTQARADAGGDRPPGGQAGGKGSWSDEWAPELAARLHAPAHDLTQRLERVIAQVQDPTLREELETCLETAFYLFATFRHISDNQRVLLGSLEDNHRLVELETLRDQIRQALAAQGMAITPDTTGDWPGARGGIPESMVTVAATVARIAQELLGQVIRVTLQVESLQGRRAAGDGVCITISCAGAHAETRTAENAAQLVFRPSVSAIVVVDWLYMEKIVELSGGSLRLYHRGDRAAGFQVRMPFAAPSTSSGEGA